MRFFYGTVAFAVWSALLIALDMDGIEVSNEAQLISMAIVIAGALAGGD